MAGRAVSKPFRARRDVPIKVIRDQTGDAQAIGAACASLRRHLRLQILPPAGSSQRMAASNRAMNQEMNSASVTFLKQAATRQMAP
jgi:hypothetical protein